MPRLKKSKNSSKLQKHKRNSRETALAVRPRLMRIQRLFVAGVYGPRHTERQAAEVHLRARTQGKVRRGIYCESSTQWRSLASRDPRRPNSNEAIRPPLGDLPRDQRERDDRKQHQQDNAHQIGGNEEQHGAVGFCHRRGAVHRIDNEQVHTNRRRD